MSVPPVDGYVMVLQPEEPKISLSGVHHFARAASEFESSEGVFLFPELRIISTITREVEPDGEGDEDPTGDKQPLAVDGRLWLETGWSRPCCRHCRLLGPFLRAFGSRGGCRAARGPASGSDTAQSVCCPTDTPLEGPFIFLA